MWRIVRRSLIGIAILGLLIWSGLFWAFFAAVPIWTYALVLDLVVILVVFVRWAWSQNMIYSETPVTISYPELGTGEEDIVDAEVIED